MHAAIVIPGQGAYGADGEYLVTERCRALVGDAGRLAETLAPEAVVFSGFAPNGGVTEAEQMRKLWDGPEVELVVEPTARITAENASRTLPLLQKRGIDEAMIVCARSHLVRTRFFFGRLYAAHGVATRFHPVQLRHTSRAIAWEIAALPLSPWQLRAARAELTRAAREDRPGGRR